MGIETRSFAPSSGVNEDPVCGSGNGSIAGFRLLAGQIAPGETYIARQGLNIGRDGKVVIRVGMDGSISVGGSCVTTGQGTIRV
jgi:PhzF family phenazine biosynthesis protein